MGTEVSKFNGIIPNDVWKHEDNTLSVYFPIPKDYLYDYYPDVEWEKNTNDDMLLGGEIRADISGDKIEYSISGVYDGSEESYPDGERTLTNKLSDIDRQYLEKFIGIEQEKVNSDIGLEK